MKIKHCKRLITSVAAVFRWLLLSPCTRSSATPLDRLSCVWTVILLMILYFQEVNTVTGRQIWGVRQVVSEAWMSVAEKVAVQIVASESPPSDTSGCYSRTLYPQPCAGERIHDAQPDKCWKKMQSVLLSFLNLMCCLWTWKLWSLTGNCLVIAKDSALITNDDHPQTLDQFKVKVDVRSLH